MLCSLYGTDYSLHSKCYTVKITYSLYSRNIYFTMNQIRTTNLVCNSIQIFLRIGEEAPGDTFEMKLDINLPLPRGGQEQIDANLVLNTA